MRSNDIPTPVAITVILVFILGCSIWLWNAIQFFSCEFDRVGKCEIVHGIGVVIPPISIITVWVD